MNELTLDILYWLGLAIGPIATAFVIYGVFWLVGRAFYSGKLSAIRSAFYSKGKKRR